MTKIYGIAAMLIAVGTAAHAANWVEIATSSSGARYSIDIESVRQRTDALGSRVTLAWFNVDFSNDATVSHRSEKDLYHFHCENYELAVIQSIRYDRSGRVVGSDNWPYASFRAAAPETVAYALIESACP